MDLAQGRLGGLTSADLGGRGEAPVAAEISNGTSFAPFVEDLSAQVLADKSRTTAAPEIVKVRTSARRHDLRSGLLFHAMKDGRVCSRLPLDLDRVESSSKHNFVHQIDWFK